MASSIVKILWGKTIKEKKWFCFIFQKPFLVCQYIVYCYIENQGKQSILCSWFFHNFFPMLTQLKVTGSSYKTCLVSLSLETLIPCKTEHYIKCQNLDSMLCISNKQERYQSEFSAALRYISSNPWLITLRSSLHHVMEWGTKRNQPWVWWDISKCCTKFRLVSFLFIWNA